MRPIKPSRQGIERADQLAAGQSPWTTATGLVVRGYVSKIDGSVQPYGLVVPESYTNKGPGRFRCDLWFHGRGETLSELNFLNDRTRNVGQFTPADTIVLHPYGRYCNANKFAGEIDVFEALDSVKKHYRIDDDRIAVRGFSMGGARPGSSPSTIPTAGSPPTPARASPRRPSSSRSFRRRPASRPGASRSSGTCTTAPTGASTCSTARRSPTAARSTARSRRPT